MLICSRIHIPAFIIMAPYKSCTETKQADGTWKKGDWVEHEMVDQRGYITNGSEKVGPQTTHKDGTITRSVSQPMKLKL